MIFFEISFRRLYVTSFEIPVMTKPWIREKHALATYSPKVHRRIIPILPKSIPPVPFTLATRPLNSSVVAFQSIFGPAILNAVPATAKINIRIKRNLYLPI